MTLHETLLKASSEEDVKAAYIKVLGLKDVQRNLIDIQTKEVWFEAKLGARHSTYFMFTQLLNYVWVALKEGEPVPPFLCVVDSVKAALMKTEVALPLLKDKTRMIKWGKSASDVTPEALDAVSQFIGTHFVSFRIETQEKEFIATVKAAIASGEIIRTQITPDNLKQVFDRWVEMIGCEISGVSKEDYALLFYADVMSDGTVSTHENLPAELLHKNGRPAFLLNGTLYNLGSTDGYRRFWAIYDRPPKEEYRNYLLERRDSLIPYDERAFKGAYYTPLFIVDKAYDLLSQLLGKNWQRDYIVVDPCCGVGNLETKHSNPRNVFMSTLDQADVDVMKAAKTCRAATRFQYDYLNDDIADDGTIDYSLTNKMPNELRAILDAARSVSAPCQDGAGRAGAPRPPQTKIIYLQNPPYAEATNADNTAKGSKMENKTGVAKTRWAKYGMARYGRCSNELFAQFITRIAAEAPGAIVATFSTLKYVNSQTFEKFRKEWPAKFLGGFVVHSKAFDGIKGDFPIGFLVWQTQVPEAARVPLPRDATLRGSGALAASSRDATLRGSGALAASSPCAFPSSISCEVLDRFGNAIGEKIFYNIPNERLLTNWATRPRSNGQEAVPLKNAVTPATSTRDLRGTHWADGALGWFNAAGNDVQNMGQKTMLLSSGYSSGRGLVVTEENLWKVAIIFAVRFLIEDTWVNHNDQVLIPDKELTEEFKLDCLIYMLFHGKNLTASADGLEWNGRKWSIVNHFIPFTEEEVNAPDRFESDFMVRYLENVKLCKCENMEASNTQLDVGCFHNSTISHFHNRSPEASAVLAAGREIWREYFCRFSSFDYSIREKFKLNRPDVGWYQIRQALKAYGESAEGRPTDFSKFESAYRALADKLRPKVYEYGFLK